MTTGWIVLPLVHLKFINCARNAGTFRLNYLDISQERKTRRKTVLCRYWQDSPINTGHSVISLCTGSRYYRIWSKSHLLFYCKYMTLISGFQISCQMIQPEIWMRSYLSKVCPCLRPTSNKTETGVIWDPNIGNKVNQISWKSNNWTNPYHSVDLETRCKLNEKEKNLYPILSHWWMHPNRWRLFNNRSALFVLQFNVVGTSNRDTASLKGRDVSKRIYWDEIVHFLSNSKVNTYTTANCDYESNNCGNQEGNTTSWGVLTG